MRFRQKYYRLEDQRASRFFSDSVGLCKAVLMERVAGGMAGKSTKRFEAMGGAVSSIGRKSTQTERATYIPR